MSSGTLRFDAFVLDPRERRLTCDGAVVELSPRYLDALVLMTGEAGQLITKDRFHDEVWRGIPVTDEALTQCIRVLRRQLGDDAANPRFIETVQRHGYRFIAPVERASGSTTAPEQTADRFPANWRQFLSLAVAGTIGAGIAGVIGGLFYGFAGTAQPLQPGMGEASVLLVFWCLTILMALIGGAGVAFGIAGAGYASGHLWRWSPAGGAIGGMIVGGVVRLLGIDAFNLMLGHAPQGITGGVEGAILGGAVGLGGWLAERLTPHQVKRGAAIAAGSGAVAGTLITLIGGRLMGGSLDRLAHSLPGSRLRLDHVGRVFGEANFGPVSQCVTGALEGALFAGCIVAALQIARRDMRGDR